MLYLVRVRLPLFETVDTLNFLTVKSIETLPPVSFPTINIVADWSASKCSFPVISNSIPDTVTDWAASESPINCGTDAADDPALRV